MYPTPPPQTCLQAVLVVRMSVSNLSMATISLSKRSIEKKETILKKRCASDRIIFIYNDLLDFAIETFDVVERYFRKNKKTSVYVFPLISTSQSYFRFSVSLCLGIYETKLSPPNILFSFLLS